ncbi:hypothetical protein, partial [Paraburkholderia caribensis]
MYFSNRVSGNYRGKGEVFAGVFLRVSNWCLVFGLLLLLLLLLVWFYVCAGKRWIAGGFRGAAGFGLGFGLMPL